MAYIALLLKSIPLLSALINLTLLSVWFIGAFGIGHFVNDICDADQDVKAGKQNSAVGIPARTRIIIISCLIIITVSPFFFLAFNLFVWLLIAIHFVMAIFYSLSPVRFKERGFWGVLVCALIEASLPVLIFLIDILATGNACNICCVKLVTLVFIWSFFLGMRNILTHQLEDMEKDSIAQVKTFAMQLSRSKIVSLNRIVTQLELVFFIGFQMILIGSGFLLFGLPLFIAICIVTVILFGRASLFLRNFYSKNQRVFYHLDLLYLIIVPCIPLIYLIYNSTDYLLLIGLHFLLFHSFLKTVFFDLVSKIKG